MKFMNLIGICFYFPSSMRSATHHPIGLLGTSWNALELEGACERTCVTNSVRSGRRLHRQRRRVHV